MSKWTLEKILACEEIKFGTMFKFVSSESKYVVIEKLVNTLRWACNNNTQGFSNYNTEGIAFYRHDGTEILPPKDKKKIKVEFWVNIYECGETSSHSSKTDADNFVTDDAFPSRIACEYFEHEVEVEDE